MLAHHPASAPRLTGNLLGELPLPSGSLQHAPSIAANIFSRKSINQIRQWQSRDGQMKSNTANLEHHNFSASNNFPEPCHSLPSSFLPPVSFLILTHCFQWFKHQYSHHFTGGKTTTERLTTCQYQPVINKTKLLVEYLWGANVTRFFFLTQNNVF